jgi:hypothetical protein
MNHIPLTTNSALRPGAGIASEKLLGVLLLALVYYVKVKLVRNTKNFAIANRRIGFGFGVGGLISIWTWAMAVMMAATCLSPGRFDSLRSAHPFLEHKVRRSAGSADGMPLDPFRPSRLRIDTIVKQSAGDAQAKLRGSIASMFRNRNLTRANGRWKSLL